MKRAILLLLGALQIGLPGPASARGRSDGLTLKQVLKRATLVVKAAPLTPFRTLVKISITPKGKPHNPKKYPPFSKTSWRFRVLDVLQGSGSKPGQTIRVSRAYWRLSLHMHRKYHLEGTTKSLSRLRYNPGFRLHQLGKARPTIYLFLVTDGNPGAYRFAVVRAFDDKKIRQKLKRYLKRAR